MTSKLNTINAVIDELDDLVHDLTFCGFELDEVLDAMAVYIDIAESLDEPTDISALV